MLQGSIFEKIFYIVLFLNIILGVLFTVNDIRDITQQNMIENRVNISTTSDYLNSLSGNFESFYDTTLSVKNDDSIPSNVNKLSQISTMKLDTFSQGIAFIGIFTILVGAFVVGVYNALLLFTVSYYMVIAIPIVIVYNILQNLPLIIQIASLFFNVVFATILFDPSTYLGNSLVFTSTDVNVLLGMIMGFFKIISLMAYVYMFYLILSFWKLTNIQNFFDVIGSASALIQNYIRLYTAPIELAISLLMPLINNLTAWVSALIGIIP